jgi:hypothetical protein
MRLYVTSFDDAIHDDLPLAAEFLTQAQYLLVVLDETPAGAAIPADAGPLAQAVQGMPHAARIAVFRLSDDKVLLRIRREPGGELMGGTPVTESAALAAQRQANSCGLALAVREAMGDGNAAAVPPM